MSEMTELQKQKLELEIADLERPVWLRPGFMVPFIAAILSLFLGYFSGWFDVQSTKLENKRFALERDIETFEAEKSDLNRELVRLKADLSTTRKELTDSQKALAFEKLKYVQTLEKQKAIKKELEDRVSLLKTNLQKAKSKGDNTIHKLTKELDDAELSLYTSRTAEKDVIKRIRELFSIREPSLSDWEQRVKEEIYRTQDVDEDGCFFIDNEQHCTNF